MKAEARFQAQIHGAEPSGPGDADEVFEDSAPTDAWLRSLRINAERRRN